MFLSSGPRSAIGEALGWIVVLGIGAVAVIHFDKVKAVMGAVMGMAPVAGVAAPGGAEASAGDERRATGGIVEIPVSRDGHYHASVEINGRSIEALVDTGASMVALTYDDARTAGIYVNPSDFTMRISTANGVGYAAPVTLDRVMIGDIMVRGVRAAVIEEGRLRRTLLGMSFLGRLSRADMRRGVLVLQD